MSERHPAVYEKKESEREREEGLLVTLSQRLLEIAVAIT
jgi:hypothetical protein